MGTPWWQLAWVWSVTGWVLIALGAVALGMGLFRDRARGRRRCPRCWYDMSGARPMEEGGEAWVCPECGRGIRGLQQLGRTRRRWGWLVVGTPLLLCGYGSLRFLDVREFGWTGAVPMTLLAAAAPTEDPAPKRYQGPAARAGPNGTIIRVTLPPLPPLAWHERLAEEAWRRVRQYKAWQWQSQWYVARALRDASIDLDGLVLVPARWPAGESIPVLIAGPKQSLVGGLGFAHAWEEDVSDATDRGGSARGLAKPGVLGSPREVGVRLQLTSTPAVVYSQVVRRPVQIVATPEEIFRCDDSAETTERARQALDMRLWLPASGGACLVMDDRSHSERWRELRLGLACELTVWLGEEVVAQTTYRPQWRRAVFKDWEELVEWEPSVAARVRAAPERVRVEVRGQARGNLASYLEWPFEDVDPACWTGTFAGTPRVVERPERRRDAGE